MILGKVEALDIDLPEIQELDPRAIIEAKLQEARKRCQGSILVEDTSLHLAAINGLPGPLIKWFLASVGVNGIYEITKRFHNFRAKARTVVGYSNHQGETFFFEDTITGQIVSPRGDQGFGWDAIFQPDGHQRTFAEMQPEEKNALSMRAKCFHRLSQALSSARCNPPRSINSE